MTEVEYKTQYIRKRLTRDNNLICDIYFEYPELICGKKELCDINSFYRQFVDNAIIFARDKSNEGEKNALRMYFSAELLCDRAIGITLFISRRKGSKIASKAELYQDWDIVSQEIRKREFR